MPIPGPGPFAEYLLDPSNVINSHTIGLRTSEKEQTHRDESIKELIDRIDKLESLIKLIFGTNVLINGKFVDIQKLIKKE